MTEQAAINKLVNAYVAFRTAPRHTRGADKLARRYAQARREALKRCGSDAVSTALGSVHYV